MKRTKKDFTKFTKRNVHKRRSKQQSRDQMRKIMDSVSEKYPHAKIKATENLGRAGRISHSPHRDEIVERGVYSSSRSGFGFVARESGGADVFIPEGRSLGAIDGDFVEIIFHFYENRFGEEKTEGRVTRIIEYGRKTVIGTAVEKWERHGKKRYRTLSLLPDDRNISASFYVTDSLVDFETGDKIEAEILRKGGANECKVIRSFGDSESREANYEAVLAECGITVDFTPEELAEAARVAAVPISHEGRVIRKEVIFTIDGEGAKDLDDAVSLVRLPRGGFRLGVHIADVSEYVKEKTCLDRAAMARGTSVYFTDKVVPMLPPALSNGACSLNSGEEKYTLSAIIDLDGEGNIRSLSIEPSVIVSRVRGVYSEVNKLFSGEADSAIKKKYRDVMPTLHKMRELYAILLKKSKSRGYLDFDAPEAEIILDEGGEPIDIVKRERGEAERMIEQFMLCANEAIATYLYNSEIPCVYRVHEKPDPEKLSSFLTYAHNLGLDTAVVDRENVRAKQLAVMLSEAEERGVSSALSYSMLRSMAKARYSEVKQPHFGLGIESYCHFTSPIRRLSDLATHRIIKRALIDKKRPEAMASYAKRAAAAASEAELRAVSAERKIEDLYKCIYMSAHVGEVFSATVSSVTSFGLFAELDNTCEGLISISEMPGVFVFDEGNVSLRSSEISYRIADRIFVLVEECDIIRAKIRFSLVGEEEIR